MLKRYLLPALLVAAPWLAQAQTTPSGAVGIGTTAPAASALLDLTSTSKGLLAPRMSKAQRDAISSPATGLTVYNTTTNKLNTWNGTSWTETLTTTEQPFQAQANYTFTGNAQTYTVPAGVRSVQVDLVGARGGDSGSQGGGAGGRVQATLTVTPGETLTLYVGGPGGSIGFSGYGSSAGGYNGGGAGYPGAGGGGGGGSDIRRGTALADRLVAAGGGGGASSDPYYGMGGSGGYGVSGGGSAGGGGSSTYPRINGPGYGAETSAGGNYLTRGSGGVGDPSGGNGGLGQGGDGAGTSSTSPYRGGGGGGGGYHGGGGGTVVSSSNSSTGGGGGGGGGSSYAVFTGASNVTYTSLISYSAAYITITATAQYAAPALDGTNFVNVPGTWQANGDNVYRAGGNVGIGTSTPGAGLHVSTAEKPSVSGAGGVYVSGGASGNPNLELRNNGGVGYIDFAHDLSSDYTSRILSSGTGLSFLTGSTSAPRLVISPTGTLTLSSLAGTGTRMLLTDANGLLSTQALPSGDNLGNHTATQNLNLGTNLLTGGGGTGLGISSTGTVGIGGAATVGTTLGVGGTATIGGAATVGGAATIGGTVGIGTTTPAASAMLDVTSTTSGFLPPRLTLMQRDAIASPAAGLTVYNTSTNKLNTWSGTSWTETLTTTEQPVQYPAQTFSGAGQYTYTVPANIRSLTVTANGAAGAYVQRIHPPNALGGAGSQVQATLVVTPGEVLTVMVGGRGAPLRGGFNGGGSGMNNTSGYFYAGGGGGASDVRRGAATLADRLLVAAGGGGGGGSGNGGNGGAPNGDAGTDTSFNTGGKGATQSSGGNQGGTLGQGGDGVGGSRSLNGSGGGGGGYYGGGGSFGYGGGGGGSSWVAPTGSSNITMTAGSNGGEGSVTIVPATVAYAAPVLDGTNFINVPGTWSVNGTSYYYNNGTVGIGTSTPNQPLTVQAGAASNSPLLGFYSQAGTDKFNFSLAGGGLNLSESNVAGGRLFVQSGTGSVGIGTTTPSQKLDVMGNANVSGSAVVAGTLGIGTTAPAGGLHITSGNGGPGTGTGTAGVVMGGAATLPPYLELRGSGTSGNPTTPYIDFAETSDQDYATRLISMGGTLNVNGSNALLLKVNGSVQATNVTYTSDARFKTHVRPLAGALSSVLALRGVRYEWNALGVQHGGTAGASQVGVLAQEVEKIYPELVSTDKEGYKAVNYAQLTPVLIEALKELAAQNEALKAELQTVKAQATTDKAQASAATDAFEARLRRLEAGAGQAQR
jgi:hypothetical protein